MSFNAGGANVAGVQAREQGVLKTSSGTTVFGGTGQKQVDFTVPAGKVWIFKKGSIGTGGTFTATYHNMRVRFASTDEFLIIENPTTSGGVTYVLDDKLYQMLSLVAGTTVRFRVNVTADTNGEMNARILYQEIDV
jgi:hypothetical protein